MIRFLADENFNNEIIRGVQRRLPSADFTRVQDTEIAGASDPEILEWAASHRFIVLTHDVNTMRGFYYERVDAGLPVPGLFLVHATRSIGAIIETLELIALASDIEDWEGEIRFVPL